HSDRVLFPSFVEPAFNHRMTDLQAAVGRPQLARLGATIAARRAIADEYAAALADHPLLAPPTEREGARANWQSYPVTLRPGARVTQVELLQRLMDRGLAVQRGVANAHQEPAYADRTRWQAGAGGLAVSERMRDSTILIPLFHSMRDEERRAVLDGLAAVAAV